MHENRIEFETDFGRASLTFVPQGITALTLPSPIDAPPVFPKLTAPLPPFVGVAIDKMKEHFSGHTQWFDDIPVVWDQGPGFTSKVYWTLRRTPPGEVTTYGELASRAGFPNAARAVASAMSANRVPLIVPCHRVLPKDGSLGSFSALGGAATKAQLLYLEGVVPKLPRGNPLFASLFEPLAFSIATTELLRRDRGLASVVSTVSSDGPAQQFPGNPFAALVESVVYQQLAGSAARAIFNRLEGMLPALTPGSVLAHRSRLAEAGLSGTKAATVVALAEAFEEGRLSADGLASASLAELHDSLESLRGIGPWTVEMFAMFHRGLPDIFPKSDLGIRNAMTQMMGPRMGRGRSRTVSSCRSTSCQLRSVITPSTR